MAKRPAWTVRNDKVVAEEFEFKWNGGFAITQKQKNIKNLHNSIRMEKNKEALEISTKGLIELGREIGAFSLEFNGISLENIFQSSKKYELGGPYIDLLSVTPREAKQDERHKTSGKIVSFIFEGKEWPIKPKTLFYDYIYVKALLHNFGENLDLKMYDWFTDIEFNPKKSINCQARSVAVYKLLQEKKWFYLLDDRNKWLEFHKNHIVG